MDTNKPDTKAVINTAFDNGEAPTAFEPLLIRPESRSRGELNDLAVDLAARSAGFQHSLPEAILTSLADLVRAMNCYYSNLIEGHNTHPVDIERALKNDYSTEASKRNLQLEAKAHIAVQAWLDRGGLRGQAATIKGIREVHRQFGEQMPEELLWIHNPDTGTKSPVIPGELRQEHVKVGHHIPISPGALPRFLLRFEQAYTGLGKLEAIVNMAAAHHRLLWVHPFLDGNGRAARLMSHAMALDYLEAGGIWSIARGLARNETKYKSHLASCDAGRRNDYDGRGNLSEEALVSFSKFFLQVCLDQVDFMAGLVQPERLRHRILHWSKEEIALGHLPPKSQLILEAILYRGELARKEIPALLNVGERQARRVVSSLLGQEILTATGPRSPLHLAFPARLAPFWMPGLFPEALH